MVKVTSSEQKNVSRVKKKKANDDVSETTVFLIIFVIVIGVVIMITNDNSTTTKTTTTYWRDTDSSMMAYIQMEHFVKQHLHAPKTADFPGIWEGKKDHITAVGGQEYIINSYVDAENLYSAKIRIRFVGKVKQTKEGEWQLIELEFL